MDFKDVHNMTLPQLKKELERIREERWSRRESGGFPNFQLDRRYLAVLHAISKIERLNKSSVR